MNPTHDSNQSTPEPTAYDIVAAWIATGAGTANKPVVSDGYRLTEVSDGYRLTEAGHHALDTAKAGEAAGTVGRVLRSAARYLERYGWIQGAYYDITATVFTPAADMVGAIAMVCYGGPCEAPAQCFEHPGFEDFEEAVLHLDRYLLAEDGTENYEFNDARGRNKHDIIRVLHAAAATSAHELIDALRAASDRQALAVERNLLPAGIFAEPIPAGIPQGRPVQEIDLDEFVAFVCRDEAPQGGDA